MEPVTCPYCKQAAELVTGATVYPYRPDLAAKNFFLCRKDKAWVGCHEGTDIPLGRLADPALRAARIVAHGHFDSLWKARMDKSKISKSDARGRAYKWLAEQMNIPVERCHIGMFDLDQVRRVIEICRPHALKLYQSGAQGGGSAASNGNG